jgi:hypothetical protein
MSFERFLCFAARNPGFSQGIHAERIDMSGEEAAHQPEKGQIRRDFSKSLLNSLLAGNCGPPKRGDFRNFHRIGGAPGDGERKTNHTG